MDEQNNSENPAEAGEEEEVIREIRELRQDIRNHNESEADREKHRRVENIQILVALGVIAATTRLITSDTSNNGWDALFQSDFWTVVVSAFLLGNILFVLLKLITIPLLPMYEDRGTFSFINNYIQPFLYLFTILMAISSTTCKYILGIIRDGKIDLTVLISEGAFSDNYIFAAFTLVLPFILAITLAGRNYIGHMVASSEELITKIYSPQVYTHTESDYYYFYSDLENHRENIRKLAYLTSRKPISLRALDLITSYTVDLIEVSSEKSAETVRKSADSTNRILIWVNDVLGTLQRWLLLILLPRTILGRGNDPLYDYLKLRRYERKHEDEIDELKNKMNKKELNKEDLEEIREMLEDIDENNNGSSEEGDNN
jgi:hypothetical protein